MFLKLSPTAIMPRLRRANLLTATDSLNVIDLVGTFPPRVEQTVLASDLS